MRSTSGEYYEKLDHVRALACYAVFVWHFIHGPNGELTPFSSPPAFFPLALLDEGYIGVSVFMCLSGYLFAKILDNSQIVYRTFLWNRFLRLAPLLVLALIGSGINLILVLKLVDLRFYLGAMLKGFIFPVWPGGAWSIATEIHFYFMLPAILWAVRRSIWLGIALLAAAIALRTAIWAGYGEVQSASYWTIVGRFDEFLLGIILCRHRVWTKGRHWLAGAVFFGFSLFYYFFDRAGGFMNLGGAGYPSKNALWIVLPTIQAFCIAFLIAWYDQSDLFKPGRISRFIATIGGVSYSIYLLHPFFVFDLSKLFFGRGLNFYEALGLATLAFVATVPVGLASFRWIEAPPLRYRRRYKTGAAPSAEPAA
ncbi:MAG: acyltransferase family protein [Rhodoblastus sp.]